MSRLLVTIQHLLALSTHPLSLTLLPICFSVGCGLAATNRPTREPYRFGTYLVALVVLTDWIPSLSTPQLVGLFRCCLFAEFIMSIVCLLAGIARCTSLGVCGSDGTRTRAHGRVSCWLLHLPVFHCHSSSRLRRE